MDIRPMSPETVKAPELLMLMVPLPESIENAPKARAVLPEVRRQLLLQLARVGGRAPKTSVTYVASNKQLNNTRYLGLKIIWVLFRPFYLFLPGVCVWGVFSGR